MQHACNSLRDLRHLRLHNCGGEHVFFSIHSGGVVYVSEPARGSSPHFAAFFVPLPVARVVLKVWVGRALFLRHSVDFRALRLVEESGIENAANFERGAVVWCFGTHYYCDPAHVANADVFVQHRSRLARPSYTFDTMRRLSALCVGIREFEASKRRLAAHIAEACHAAEPSVHYPSLDRCIARQREANDALSCLVYSRKVSLSRLAQAHDENAHADAAGHEDALFLQTQAELALQALGALKSSLRRCLKPVIETVQRVFPIDCDGDRFAIVRAEFPSSVAKVLECSRQEVGVLTHVNAALAHIVRLVRVLAQVTRVRLKHEMRERSLGGCIYDYRPQRVEFPLHVETKPEQQAPLETGLRLLQANIHCLVAGAEDLRDATLHIPPDSADNFLWILHYLCLFLTADEPTGTEF